MKISNIISATLLALAIAAPAALRAESNTISPYSRFGYGILAPRSNSMQKGMGGVGYAMRSGREINFMNPASYAAMDSLTFLFDMGVDIKSLHTTDEAEKGNNFTGGLDYITMQVPLARWISASAGLAPVSSVGYSFGDKITDGQTAHNGNGDINEVFLGIGVKPFHGFTAGVNIGYIFGTLVNSDYIYQTNEETGVTSTSLFERETEVRDYSIRIGLQYGLPIAKDHELTVGLVYEPSKSLRGHARGIKYDVNAETEPQYLADIKLKDHASLPDLWGAGISYQWQKRILAEVDFTYQPWKGVKYATIPDFGDATSQFADSWRIAAGVQFTNRQRGPWIQRVNWRLGGYYSRDYITVRGNNIREYGATIGFGLPAPSSKTVVNLSLEYRNRQATPAALVKEDYFIVTLGINFNELWFWRNKIK